MERTQVIVGGGSRARKVLCPPQAIAALPTAEIIDSLAKATGWRGSFISSVGVLCAGQGDTRLDCSSFDD